MSINSPFNLPTTDSPPNSPHQSTYRTNPTIDHPRIEPTLSALSLKDQTHLEPGDNQLETSSSNQQYLSRSLDHPPSHPIPPEFDDPDPEERLPTYHELKNQEGHRFGRWRGWIEKRARERYEASEFYRRQSNPPMFGTGWDLPELNSTTQHPNPPTSLDRSSSIISAKDEQAAFKSASKNHKDAFLNHRKGKFHGSSSTHRPNLEPGPGAVNLTPSTSIHQIGSRFLPQFPSQPLCAIPLPLSRVERHSTSSGPPVERFLLVGTIDGLYVCDLIPSLSSTVKKDLISPTDSKIYQIWQGLGIHQLEVAIETGPASLKAHSTGPNSSSLPGIVIALTSPTSESTINGCTEGVTKSIKMWPVQSLINLVKFRAFSENSECLDLQNQSPNSTKSLALSAGTSALAGLKSMFEKGKQKAEGSILSFTDNHSDPYSSPKQGTHSRHLTDNYSPSRLSTSNVSFTSSYSPPLCGRKSSNASHLELPLQWATQSISLDLPRIQANGPILFIKLSTLPAQGFNPISDQFDQIIGSNSIPTALRPKSRDFDGTDDGHSGFSDNGWWYLIIATKQLIFIMESQPNSHRKWHLCAEMSAPFAAKTAHLVLAEFPKHPHSRSISQSRCLNLTRRAQNPRIGFGELSVLLTMKEYAVVISLSDLSVRELDLIGTLAISHTTSSISPHAPASRSTSGSFSGLNHLERVQSNFKPFARNMSLISGSIEPILTNKRNKDGFGKTLDDGFQVENRRPGRLINERRWVGCEELLIPVPNKTIRSSHPSEVVHGNINDPKEIVHHRSIYLITRGYLTSAVICPIGLTPRSRCAKTERFNLSNEQTGIITTGGVPPPLLLKPFHTFTWKAMPIKVLAHIVPTPRKWKKAEPQNEHLRHHHDLNSNEDDDELFCCLTAFTTSGVEVQEGFISLKILRLTWESGSRKQETKKHSFFMPASHYYRHRFRQTSSSSTGSSTSNHDQYDPLDQNNLTKLSESPEGRRKIRSNSNGPPLPKSSSSSSSSVDQSMEIEELHDNSSYDYGAKIGYLCSSAAWFSTSNSTSDSDSSSNSTNNSHQFDGQSQPHLERNSNSFNSTTSTNTVTYQSSNQHHQHHSGSADDSRNCMESIQDYSNISQDHFSTTRGSFFWKQAVGEWKIMYVCNSMDL